MLQSLHVHNFALIEDVKADFTDGFNVFTGETGAGKSILIDAFNIVLGGRSSTEYVRKGTDGFLIQAVFDICDRDDVKALLEEQAIEAEDELFIRRQQSINGKGKIFVNGIQVAANFLRNLGEVLVNIHGQHENQVLLKPDTPREMTDQFGGIVAAAALTAYKETYKKYTELKDVLEKLQQDSEQQEILADRYNWEIQEITAAHLQQGEDEALEAEARLLQNHEKIVKATDGAYKLLDDDGGALTLLAEVKELLRSGARYDNSLAQHLETVTGAWLALDDCRGELASYLDRSDFNAEHVAKVQQRLDLIHRMKKKYGGSIASVQEHLLHVQQRYDELMSIAATIAAREKELDLISKELQSKAEHLTAVRCRNAAALSAAVTEQIHDLAMPEGIFRVEVQSDEKYGKEGKDKLFFCFSANAGEAVSALEKVASGGELSRIALALKTVLLGNEKSSTVVFDEIDTGVGGITAQRMAEKLVVLSSTGQILCITHLPQIAALADNHIQIAKYVDGGRTVTKLTILDYDGKVGELVRMAAGESKSAAAVSSAKELLDQGNALKKRLITARGRGVR